MKEEMAGNGHLFFLRNRSQSVLQVGNLCRSDRRRGWILTCFVFQGLEDFAYRAFSHADNRIPGAVIEQDLIALNDVPVCKNNASQKSVGFVFGRSRQNWFHGSSQY